MDPHILLGDNPANDAHSAEAIELQNKRRRELIEWAADEMVVLSARVELDLTKPKTTVSTAAAASNVAMIEQLAKNLTAALKAK
ncbi:hypothetical protein ACPOL_5089 [Acidisarcina polymorpha]|uniref:Uncharacterized protein n=1 Tax=Acidisarcina polymorpha TaxID=2211140 RepID=A0A2Z5G6R7_9BACT|nr:hypothetical protein [Acidisarcina polymorpha]AXC14345.1 hypothetical protein ACPOL_5089 [Acidisarcina polymorpha]